MSVHLKKGQLVRFKDEQLGHTAGWKGAFQERELHEQSALREMWLYKFEFVVWRSLWWREANVTSHGDFRGQVRELGFILWGMGSGCWALRWQVT